jgi:hypothetical protein
MEVDSVNYQRVWTGRDVKLWDLRQVPVDRPPHTRFGEHGSRRKRGQAWKSCVVCMQGCSCGKLGTWKAALLQAKAGRRCPVDGSI